VLKNFCCIEFREGSKEEILPDFMPDFPYISSYMEFDRQKAGRFVPWHWHKEVELFYVESGVVEYYIPKGKAVFPAGSGGLVNSNVLHMTKSKDRAANTVQLNHIFDVSLIGGHHGSRIEQKYILPLTTASQIGIIRLDPKQQDQDAILKDIRKSFQISSNGYAYEIKLRSALSDIWARIFALSAPLLHAGKNNDKTDDTLKLMLIYIHEHFWEKVTVKEISSAAFISERECFRTFRECLHTTPLEYLRNYRLQQACRMLTQGQETITAVSHACGLGSSSYFGSVFKDCFGCSPMEYRRKWQDCDITRQV